MLTPHITVDADSNIPETVAIGVVGFSGLVVPFGLCAKVITKKRECFAQNRASKKYRQQWRIKALT